MIPKALLTINLMNCLENKTVARQGGQVANAAKKQLEVTTGKKVITSKNAKESNNRKSIE